MRARVESELKRTFRPELLNRLDDVIIFRPLTREHLSEIIGLMLRETQQRLAERSITLEVDGDARTWLMRVGYDPVFGARPLRRAIERYVENPLSARILAGEVHDGDHVQVGAGPDALTFTVTQPVRT